MSNVDFTLDDLTAPIKWLGDSIGLDDVGIVRLRDALGRHCDPTHAELLAHPVWEQLDAYARIRMENRLSSAVLELT